MEFKKIDDIYVIRLEPGEEIISNIKEFCKQQGIKSGFFYGIGALNEVELNYFSVPEKKYYSAEFKQGLEITSLIGNVSYLENEVIIHAHINLADREMNVLGGHLKKGIISATCEIMLQAFDQKITRKRDEKTGLNLMDLK